MLKHILPTLIELIEGKGVPLKDIREISLNEKTDGTYILTNHRMDYCPTNQFRGSSVVKQFHAVKSYKTDQWEVRPSGCGHVKYEWLTFENLDSSWEDDLIVEKRGNTFCFLRGKSAKR